MADIRTLWEWLQCKLLYGGLNKEQYQSISSGIEETNRKNLVTLSTVNLLVYALRLFVFNYRIDKMSMIAFSTAILVFTFIAAANHKVRGNRWLVNVSSYLFMIVYIAIGIVVAVGEGGVKERTTLYLVFVVSAPMMLALNTIEQIMILMPLEIVYLITIAKFQSSYPVYATNQSNSLFFSFSGLLLGSYMFHTKISGIYNACMNSRLQEIEELNEKLNENKKELQVALAAAEHANRAKTAFLNNMSHDIRTPMNAIIGFTSLAATHIDNKEQVQDYLGKIMTSSQHLLSLINDVLDMSRIESGKVKIEEKPLHLPDVLHDICTIIQSGITSKRLDLFIDTEGVKNEDIIADKLRLNQILINLLSNCIKFTPTGGNITIRVIQTPTAPEGYADYEFRIKDNGIGMGKEFQEHIFDAFSRENSATVSGIQGTGLGMAITKNIVDMMGGTIVVESTEGKGTEFIVNLRFAVSGGDIQYEIIPHLQGLRALVADDDTNTCLNVGQMLREIGMRPEWTISGKEAVIRAEDALKQADEFSVYIIDWLMPDMNGIETVRRIRRVVGDSKPIFILTAYDWSDIEEEAKEAGVTAFVSKPLFLSELRDVLSRPFRVQPQQPQQGRSVDFKGKSILLVEDNALNQEIAQSILEEFGFTVDLADDGTVAVEKMQAAKSGQYDVILMDIQMPQMDGFEATKRIRAMSDIEKAGIPIIAMTANAFEEDRRAAIEAGMDGYVAKPIDVESLMKTLEDIFI